MDGITEIDLKDKVYALLKQKGVDLLISGRIYKDKRPMNSPVEDILISVLDSGTAQVQEFIVNVNAYIPDVKRDDEYIEDTPRLRSLAPDLGKALESFVADCYQISLSKQRIMEVQDANLHVINNRVNVRYSTA